jgi:hypothetical protein
VSLPGVLQYLFLPAGPTSADFARWGPVLAAVYVTLAVAVVYFTYVQRTLNGSHRLKNGITQYVLWWGLGLQAAGLLLLGLRWVDWGASFIPALRFLILVQVVVECVAAGYLLWWLRRHYPHALAAYEWDEKKRAYLPRAAGGTVDSLRRKTPAGHRR